MTTELRDMAYRAWRTYRATLQHAMRWGSTHKLAAPQYVRWGQMPAQAGMQHPEGLDWANPWASQLLHAWLAYINAKHAWQQAERKGAE